MNLERVRTLALLAIATGKRVCTVQDLLSMQSVLAKLAVDDSIAKEAVGSIAAEQPIAVLGGNISVPTSTYVTVATWTVTSRKVGILLGLEFECATASQYGDARFRFTVNDVVVFEDVQINASLTLAWPGGVEIAAGKTVLLEANTQGAALQADGDITGKEVAA